MVKQLKTVAESNNNNCYVLFCGSYYVPIKFKRERKNVIVPKVYIVNQSKCLKVKI